MLQIKGFRARVFGGVIRQFRGKTETKFCTTQSNICILLALCRFSDDFHRNKFELRPLTTTRMLSTERGKIHRRSHVWSTKCNSRPKPLRTVINFGSFTQRNAPDHWSDDPFADHLDQWSDESLSRVDSIDHCMIWKRICSKETPQIRNPDPDPPEGTHPRFQFCNFWVQFFVYVVCLSVFSLLPNHKQFTSFKGNLHSD